MKIAIEPDTLLESSGHGDVLGLCSGQSNAYLLLGGPGDKATSKKPAIPRDRRGSGGITSPVGVGEALQGPISVDTAVLKP